MTQSEHPWMRHDVTGHWAQLPDEPYWRAHGWQLADGPPPEPDRLHDQVPEEDETPPEPAGSSAAKKKTAKKTADELNEGSESVG